MRRHRAVPTAIIAALVLALLAGCGAGAGLGSMHTGTPTATAAPPTATVGTPTPTPTALEQRLEALVQPAIAPLAFDMSVRFDSVTNAPFVRATVNPGPTVPTTQELVKTVCFLALQALWTSGEKFNDVSVAVFGPFQDDFGNHVIQTYASAEVNAQTAAKLNWAQLTPETAWNDYTNVFLAPSYAAGQYWGLPTPTPFSTGDVRTHLAV